MADDMRWRGGQEATRREFDEAGGRRKPGRVEPRSYSSGRPYGDGDYGWRGGYREYGWRDVPGYERQSAHNPGASQRDEPFDRDYSGVSWGLSGGHRQDRDVARTGAGLEAGYANFHRPDAPDRAAGEWRVAGPHAGRGPRGYRRSDQRIADDVNDRLTAHGWIDAADVECKVEEGEVLLTGFVDSRAAKRAAEDCRGIGQRRPRRAQSPPGSDERARPRRRRTHQRARADRTPGADSPPKHRTGAADAPGVDLSYHSHQRERLRRAGFQARRPYPLLPVSSPVLG